MSERLSFATPPEWSREAACVDEWEVMDAGGAEALANCASCPVREACLQAAMEEEKGQGLCYRWLIRGGLTPEQRYERARDSGERILPVQPTRPSVKLVCLKCGGPVNRDTRSLYCGHCNISQRREWQPAWKYRENGAA